MRAVPLLALLLAIAAAAAAPAMAQAPHDGVTAVQDRTEIAYGSDRKQTIDVWRPTDTRARAPLVLFVHGGAWTKGDKDNATGRYKAGHYTGQDYVFASANYRLVPDVAVEDQAQDVANAVAALVEQAHKLGIDPDRIVLMGHSAGAHLVSLVGTDPRYLARAGLSLPAIDGVIALDGAAYDVPRQMAQGGRFMQRIYRQVFGTDTARQQQLSPAAHAASPNARRFLILHVEREDGAAQARLLANALRDGGTDVEVTGFAGKGLRGHAEINRRMGDPEYVATAVVDRCLSAAIAE